MKYGPFDFKEFNCFQEQVVAEGKCPFCKSVLQFEFEVEDFIESYRCVGCGNTFWLDKE